MALRIHALNTNTYSMGGLVLLGSLALAGCGDDERSGTSGSKDPSAGTVPAAFEVRPGVEIATVFGSDPGTPLTLYDAEGNRLITMISDAFGQAHFAYIGEEHIEIDTGNNPTIPVARGSTLAPASGYVIRDDSSDPPEASAPFDVIAVDDVPETSVYEGQVLKGIHFGLTGLGAGEVEDDGFNYITVRDGVKLSVMVRFPDPLLYGDGPYPTLIEYSGYSPSRPGSMEPGSRIATLLGYATVGVNMRGSGCSGGVFDVFNPAQHADGYDVVEVVARQPWVLNNEVGMVGLSYSGIAQLYVASTQPPSLAAVTPMSVIRDSWQQAWPGGIYNDGFTREWLAERDRQAAAGGMSWTATRVEGGDELCEQHQQLRQQNIEFESFFRMLEFSPPAAASRSLPLLIDDIEVPVYLTGAWQDEQTGPQFANMLDGFDAAPATKFTMFNGRHPDGYSPLVLTRWFEFAEFYVAKRVPKMQDLVRSVGGPEFAKEFGVTGLEFEPDRFVDFTADDYQAALAQYEAEPHVRVLFESGGNDAFDPGAPAARFEQSFPSWPPPNAQPRSFYLASSGELADASPTSAAIDAFLHDPDAGAMTFLADGAYDLMGPLWDTSWTQFAEGNVLSYLTAPFSEDTVVAGPGYAELWVTSDADDLHLQVTLTEVRSDDIESLVTSGWLRVGHAVDESTSDTLRINHTFSEENFTPLTPGEFTHVKVAIPSVAQAFRSGSRLRVMISTPGRNHARWAFENPGSAGTPAEHQVALGGDRPSRVVLPIVSGIDVTPGLPACPSLRGQPCRPYEPRANSGG